MASCIGKLLDEWRVQGVLYSRRCLGCGLRWPREMPLGWPVILVCMEGASVSCCSCLLSCSPSTRTYLLSSFSPYTLYRMILPSLLHESLLPRSLVISHYVLLHTSLGGVFSECPWGGQLQGEVSWESPWDCPLQRDAPWRLHQMHCEIAWGVALKWPVALGSSLVSGVGKACCTQGAVWVVACSGHGGCPWDGQSFWYAWRVLVCRVDRVCCLAHHLPVPIYCHPSRYTPSIA